MNDLVPDTVRKFDRLSDERPIQRETNILRTAAIGPKWRRRSADQNQNVIARLTTRAKTKWALRASTLGNLYLAPTCHRWASATSVGLHCTQISGGGTQPSLSSAGHQDELRHESHHVDEKADAPDDIKPERWRTSTQLRDGERTLAGGSETPSSSDVGRIASKRPRTVRALAPMEDFCVPLRSWRRSGGYNILTTRTAKHVAHLFRHRTLWFKSPCTKHPTSMSTNAAR